MAACKVLSLVPKIISRFSKLTRSDVPSLFFIEQRGAQGFYPPDFAVQNVTIFSPSGNPDSGFPHALMHFMIV